MHSLRTCAQITALALACRTGIAPAQGTPAGAATPVGESGLALRLSTFMADPAPPALPTDITLSMAVRRALSNNPNIRIQEQQVRFNEGVVQQARGAYDPALVGQANQEMGPHPLRSIDNAGLVAAGAAPLGSDQQQATSYGVGVQQTLSSGMQLDSGVNVTSNRSELNARQGIPRQTAGTIRFSVRVPLQRNARGVQLSSALQASELERAASVEDLVQTSSGVVLQVVASYWELSARIRRLEILREAEQRATDLVAELRKLVSADQIPAADLNLALASEAEKRAARVAEEQLMQEAWRALARLLYTDTRDVLARPPVLDALPEVDASLQEELRLLEQRRKEALELRPDLRAARLRERSAAVLVAAAHNNLRPQVDLVAGASTNSLAESTSALRATDALGRDILGPTLNLGVEMRWPYRNDVAQGQLLERSALRDQATLRLRDLEVSVGPSLATVAGALTRILQRYRDTLQATERYAVSVQNETTKRRLGLSTLIDVINVQDRLDASRLLLFSLRQEYATQLAQLRFDGGTLVRRDGRGEFDVDTSKLQGFPSAGAR